MRNSVEFGFVPFLRGKLLIVYFSIMYAIYFRLLGENSLLIYILIDRNLLVIVCRNSAEVGILQHNEDRLQWTMLDLENERAGTPFVGKKETFPIGKR